MQARDGFERLDAQRPPTHVLAQKLLAINRVSGNFCMNQPRNHCRMTRRAVRARWCRFHGPRELACPEIHGRGWAGRKIRHV